MSYIQSASAVEPYSLLRSALALFQKTPNELDENQREQVIQQANKEYDIETRVLQSPEASGVMVSDDEINKALESIQQRFEDKASFHEELARNDLDLDTLKTALLRQCKVENIMERVASKAAKVSDVEVGIFYHMHPEKFHRQEHRRARHILVTINDEYAENARETALKRIKDIAAQLKQRPEKFGDLAMRHSECPTALNGGDLGSVNKGVLYPEIDTVLFELREGQISDVIETEVGFHLVVCSQIIPEQQVSLNKARPQIRQMMEDRARRVCQRAWLANLPNGGNPSSNNN